MNNSKFKLKDKEQILLFKRLHMFSKSGTPLPQACELLQQGVWSRKMKLVLNFTLTAIKEGKRLSDALTHFSTTFQPLTINVIKMGESSGTLMNSFDYITTELTKQHNLKRKILTALLYPLIVILATCITLGIIFFYVFPKILPVFASLHVPLPLTTRILLAFTKFCSAHYLILAGCLILSIAVGIIVWKSQKFRTTLDDISLKIPFVKLITKYYVLANMTRTLGHLTDNNIPIMKAVTMTIDATSHSTYKSQLAQLETDLKQGLTVSHSFKQSPHLYPNIVAQLIATGERTGSLSESLLYISQLYDQEITDFIDKLTTLLEPMLMIVIGIIVGCVALSIITPIYGITQHLSP